MRLERTLTRNLVTWKERADHKPLLIRGARQTGKTWLVNDFAANNYDGIVGIDFMKRDAEKELFDQDLDPIRIIRQLETIRNVRINPGRTLVFFDEIQECPRALTSLKYFCEDAPQYDVVATGSYMGISRHRGGSFPVGKVDMLTLHPLTFTEYLRNIGQTMVADLIDQGKFEDIPTALNQRLEAQLKTYMWVGGMPAPLAAHIAGATPGEIRAIQDDILDAYDLDFSKHAPQRIEERIRLVWDTIPAQFAKENRKFMYGVARHGARAREFEETLMWLKDYGIITRVPCLDAIRLPLTAYENLSAFKVYIVDTGLLCALAKLEPTVLAQGDNLLTEFKGALTEQYVCQQLASQGFRPAYWANPNPKGQSEVDFVISRRGAYPIEVKSERNLHAKSLGVAYREYGLSHAVRTSMAGYRDQDWVANIPLWCMPGIGAYLGRAESQHWWGHTDETE